MAMGVNSAIDGMLARAFLGDTLTEVSAIASLAVEVLPTVAAGIVIAALCAAVMSTADSLLLACTSHVVNDIYLGAMGKSASDEKSSKTDVCGDYRSGRYRIPFRGLGHPWHH